MARRQLNRMTNLEGPGNQKQASDDQADGENGGVHRAFRCAGGVATNLFSHRRRRPLA